MYTIEKHLNDVASINTHYELLNSIWIMNKNVIPNAHSAITYNFPHYSLHETSHSATIIKNIESFLGEDRIRSLSPTNAWLILMSAYTHDLGMVVFHNVLEKKWKHKDFQEYLIRLSTNTYDRDLKRASIILLETDKEGSSRQENDELSDSNIVSNSLDVRKAVTIIITDYFRKNHH